MTNQPRQILKLGDPVLREVAQPIDDIQSPEIQALIDELIETVRLSNGVGIAAPQVGQSIQLMIVASHPTPRYPYAPTMAPIAMINPHIIEYSEVMEKDWEGCLSVPGQRGLVPRHGAIAVAYLDRQGQSQQAEFVGFVARIFQHEYDHFQGIVFLDRVETEAEIITEEAYQAMLQSQS